MPVRELFAVKHTGRTGGFGLVQQRAEASTLLFLVEEQELRNGQGVEVAPGNGPGDNETRDDAGEGETIFSRSARICA